MTVIESLLWDVISDPSSDNARLLYADYIEEFGGQAERAEFIRAQCAIARICRGNRSGAPTEDADQLDTLISRESGLMYGVWELGWLDPVPREWLLDCVINRGFVATVECRCEDWLQHGPAVVACQPVERVRLTDRAPSLRDHGRKGNGYCWFGSNFEQESLTGNDPDSLPDVLVDIMPTGIQPRRSIAYRYRMHGTPDAAHDALSTACLLWARQQAGLATTNA